MKYFLILVMSCLISFSSLAQEVRAIENFIITIDKNVSSDISNVRFIITDSGNKKTIIQGNYIPGQLSVRSEDDRVRIRTDSTATSIVLAFDNTVFARKLEHINNYEIRVNSIMLSYSFALLQIHSLNRRHKNKYNFSWTFPGYSILPTRKN